MRIELELSLRFEPFLALHAEAPDDEIARELWLAVPDALDPADAPASFPALTRALREVPSRDFARRVLAGALHDEEAAEALLAGRTTLRDVVARAPRKKREWLGFMGLYPLAPAMEATLEKLIQSPMGARRKMVDALERFIAGGFGQRYRAMLPLYRRSLEAHRAHVDPADAVRATLLPIEIQGGELRALRGGDRAPLDRVEVLHVSPSAFNERRHWFAYGAHVHLPYFDPTLRGGEVPLDPALGFRALGDATRWAMASLIARTPMSSTDLARALGLGKPTVSHHVHVLREAGLVEETPAPGRTLLSLRRQALERLSLAAVEKLFEDTARPRLRTTRRGR
jgi:DNA-binding transcriptional ArsR family regulator